MTSRKQTKAELKRFLARVEAEYDRALLEITGKPDGNGYATQKQMRKAVAELYGSTIGSLRRRLGLIY